MAAGPQTASDPDHKGLGTQCQGHSDKIRLFNETDAFKMLLCRFFIVK